MFLLLSLGIPSVLLTEDGMLVQGELHELFFAHLPLIVEEVFLLGDVPDEFFVRG